MDMAVKGFTTTFFSLAPYPCWKSPSAIDEEDQRLAILAMVARLQPVAAWIFDHEAPVWSIAAIPSLRAVSSGRPL
jgi:hypothetical protein